MNKRRMISASLAAAVMLTVAACGSDDDSASTTAAPADTGAATTAAPETTAGGAETTTAGSSAGPATGEPIQIGQLVGLTGFAAASLGPAADASAAWEKWVNENGGINGQPVKVNVADTASDGAKGLAGAQSLVEDNKVVAFVGNQDPTGEGAASQYLTDNAIPVIGASTQIPMYFTNPNFFPVGGTTSEQYHTIQLALIEKAGFKSYALAGCSEVPACASSDATLKAEAPKYNVDYTGFVPITATAPNYTAECLKMKQDGVEIVELAVAAATGPRVVADCTAQDFNPAYIFPQNAFQSGVLDIPAITAYGGLTNKPYYLDDESLADFHAAMEANGVEVETQSVSALFAWEALEMFRTAMAGAPANPTSADVTAAMFTIKDVDLGGIIPEPVSYVEGETPAMLSCIYAAYVENGDYAEPPVGNDPICMK